MWKVIKKDDYICYSLSLHIFTLANHAQKGEFLYVIVHLHVCLTGVSFQNRSPHFFSYVKNKVNLKCLINMCLLCSDGHGVFECRDTC